MARTLLYVVLASGLAATACNNNNPFLTQPTDTSTPAVLTTDTFDGSVTVNGGTTNPFIVNRAGTVTAVVSALEPSNEIRPLKSTYATLCISPANGKGNGKGNGNNGNGNAYGKDKEKSNNR